MQKMVAIVYPDQSKAAEVYAALQKMQDAQLLDMDDAVYVTKDKKGKLKLHQSTSLTGEGAVVGGTWGLLIGMLFLSPLLGAAVGAGGGAIAGKAQDYGIDDNFIKELSRRIQPNTSAIFVSVGDVVVDKVVPELSQFGGHIIQTSLPKETEKKLQRALDDGAMKAEYDRVMGA